MQMNMIGEDQDIKIKEDMEIMKAGDIMTMMIMKTLEELMMLMIKEEDKSLEEEEMMIMIQEVLEIPIIEGTNWEIMKI